MDEHASHPLSVLHSNRLSLNSLLFWQKLMQLKFFNWHWLDLRGVQNFRFWGHRLMKHQSFTPVPGNTGWNHSACRHPLGYPASCTWCNFILLWWGVFYQKIFLTVPLHFWQVGVWVRFFNLHLKINLLVQRNTRWQLVLQVKPWLRFERGSKFQKSCGVIDWWNIKVLLLFHVL